MLFRSVWFQRVRRERAPTTRSSRQYWQQALQRSARVGTNPKPANQTSQPTRSSSGSSRRATEEKQQQRRREKNRAASPPAAIDNISRDTTQQPALETKPNIYNNILDRSRYISLHLVASRYSTPALVMCYFRRTAPMHCRNLPGLGTRSKSLAAAWRSWCASPTVPCRASSRRS